MTATLRLAVHLYGTSGSPSSKALIWSLSIAMVTPHVYPKRALVRCPTLAGGKIARHCTHVLRGHYSKKISAHNKELLVCSPMTFDERPVGTWHAIYLCGVAKEGYARKLNYLHNLHVAIAPEPGHVETTEFERWTITIENGRSQEIPNKNDLMEPYGSLAEEFTSCRIFRWAVAGYPALSSAE